jgi:hypothetical protein
MLAGVVPVLTSLFQQRFDANPPYVMRLRVKNLLQNHYLDESHRLCDY